MNQIFVSERQQMPQSATPAEQDRRAPADVLRDVLLESRQRWRELMILGADLVFETDQAGCFTFIAPDPALGWEAGALLGRPAIELLAEGPAGSGFNPFRPPNAQRSSRAWLKRADGSTACLSFAAAPVLDEAGQIIGARGTGQDVTDQEGQDSAIAARLRRGEVLDHILWRMRQEVLAPRMMQSALEAMVHATGSAGAAVIDALTNDGGAAVLHRSAPISAAVLSAATALLECADMEPLITVAADQSPVLVCPSQTRFGEQAGLVLWRAAAGRDWDADDKVLASSATGIVRVILEHESIQREMARLARTDPLTGLLNRRAFLEELARRVDRLDREGLPGTLIFVDLDRFKELNDYRGHDVGDDALCITATLLRSTFRPTDLVARLGGDEFAIWLDTADELTAAERAEQLIKDGPESLAHLTEGTSIIVGMSIGIATRWPTAGEEIDDLMQRADQVMYEVKRAGRGRWRVSRPSAA